MSYGYADLDFLKLHIFSPNPHTWAQITRFPPNLQFQKIQIIITVCHRELADFLQNYRKLCSGYVRYVSRLWWISMFLSRC